MLQQTRVETVLPYYERFLRRFPTLHDLAESSEEDVLTLWSGLGYYRRARALRQGAIEVVESHGGKFPRELADALSLPGIGRYTAGAILSIAYGVPVSVVDGNVERVLTRYLCLSGDPRRGPTKRRLWSITEECLPDDAPGDFNQALMELGATVCTPQNPQCDVCPLRRDCLAHARGQVDRFPELAPKRQAVPVTLQAAIVASRGRFLLQRNTGNSFLKDMWMFPFVEGDEANELCAVLRRTFGCRFRLGATLKPIRHAITFRKITVYSTILEPQGSISTRGHSAFRWARPSEFGDAVPVSSLALKIKRGLSNTAS